MFPPDATPMYSGNDIRIKMIKNIKLVRLFSYVFLKQDFGRGQEVLDQS